MSMLITMLISALSHQSPAKACYFCIHKVRPTKHYSVFCNKCRIFSFFFQACAKKVYTGLLYLNMSPQNTYFKRGLVKIKQCKMCVLPILSGSLAGRNKASELLLYSSILGPSSFCQKTRTFSLLMPPKFYFDGHAFTLLLLFAAALVHVACFGATFRPHTHARYFQLISTVKRFHLCL